MEAERAKNLVSRSRAVSGCKKVPGAGAGGCGVWNGARSRNQGNRFEQQVEIMPLPLHSHALPVMESQNMSCLETWSYMTRSWLSLDTGTWLCLKFPCLTSWLSLSRIAEHLIRWNKRFLLKVAPGTCCLPTYAYSKEHHFNTVVSYATSTLMLNGHSATGLFVCLHRERIKSNTVLSADVGKV